MRSLSSLALLSGALLALASAARAQDLNGFRVPTEASNLPTAQTQATVRPVAAPSAGFYGPNPSFGWGPSPYSPWVSYLGPTGGALTGAANLVNASGEYLNQVQQSRQAMNQADLGKLQVNRAIFEEQQYERRNTVTAEQVRQFQRQRDLQRSCADPPKNEIWNASALNDLFGSIKDMEVTGLRGPEVPLDPDTVRRLNLTDGTVRGTSGLLRDLPLNWPLVLQDSRFDKPRNAIDKLLPGAMRYAAQGRVDLKTFNDLNNAVSDLRQINRDLITVMSPSDNIRAKRYLNDLDSSLSLLREPNVANFFNGKFDARGNSVGDLVTFMVQNGLTFGPASPGDESFYMAFYQALRTYEFGLSHAYGAGAPR